MGDANAIREARYGRSTCPRCGELYRVSMRVAVDHVCGPVGPGADIEFVEPALLAACEAGDLDRARSLLGRTCTELCYAASATGQDPSFVYKRGHKWQGMNKAHRATKIYRFGNGVRFELERHPDEVELQVWEVDMTQRCMRLVSDTARDKVK